MGGLIHSIHSIHILCTVPGLATLPKKDNFTLNHFTLSHFTLSHFTLSHFTLSHYRHTLSPLVEMPDVLLVLFLVLVVFRLPVLLGLRMHARVMLRVHSVETAAPTMKRCVL